MADDQEEQDNSAQRSKCHSEGQDGRSDEGVAINRFYDV